MNPEKACNIIAACIVLHNRAVDYRHPVDEEDMPDDRNDDDNEIVSTQSTQGTLFIETFFSLMCNLQV